MVNGWQRPSAQFCDTNACVEVAPCESAHCVEVGRAGAGFMLRASGAPETEVELTAGEFRAFVGAVKAGEYDHMID